MELPTWAQSTLAKSVNPQIYESEKYMFLQDTEILGFCFIALMKQNINDVTTNIYWLCSCDIVI